jgi:plastocyanin
MAARLRAIAALATVLVCASCLGLSHPLSDDGADANNPNGHNPGTQVLSVTIQRSLLMVGDTVSIVGSVNGVTISSNGLLVTSSSDPAVATVGGAVIFARGVGTATIDVAYSGYQASPPITVSVVANSQGTSAVVTLPNSATAFVPTPLGIKVGQAVEFRIGSQHNVVFDVLSGAPAGIAQSPTGSNVTRQFLVPGTFSYSCTLHGETGTVVVTH